MPVYEYRCDACNIPFELRQKFSDPPADKCPKCGGTVRKLVSAASFSLKGGGWYGDGYGDKAEPTKLEGDITSAETVAATEGASTDKPVPAEKADTATSPANQEPAPTQVETKIAAAEAPTPTKDKAEVKSSTSDAVS